MSTATAIGMVSQSLQNLLEGEMSVNPTPGVTILAPDESGGDNRINLFLYKVQENPVLKNMDWQVKPGSPNQLAPPPLSLNLFYLMTAYNKNDPRSGNSQAHEILGDAMRVFYEYPIVPGEYLPGMLRDSREQVKIMLNTLDLEELSKVWATFTKAFRLSVLYEVSVVQLDMLPEKERIMAQRVRKTGVPEVKSHYHPPVIEDIRPVKGKTGSRVQILGKHFSGWNAYVYIDGKKLLDGRKLNDDIFRFDLADDLLPGFYDVRVDISHLCRRTFLFEVTS
jgi:hypothetical protein